MRILIASLSGLFAIFALITSLASFTSVEPGEVGVKLRWSQVVGQEGPGFYWKNPISESFQIIDVRERRSTESMSVSARELPVTAEVSMNWKVNSTAATDIYVQHGTIDVFEQEKVLPIFRQAVKAAMGSFGATELLTQRGVVADAALQELVKAFERLPISVASLQIENVTLPETYMARVREREDQRQRVQQAREELERIEIEAQREVKTAEAEANARRARAEAQAFETEIQANAQAAADLALRKAEAEGLLALGKAKAEALRLEAEALSSNPNLVELERARRWSGDVPKIVLGENSGVLPLLDMTKISGTSE